jgi:hypothetical protein
MAAIDSGNRKITTRVGFRLLLQGMLLAVCSAARYPFPTWKCASMGRPWSHRSGLLYREVAGWCVSLSCFLLAGTCLYAQSSPDTSIRIVVLDDNAAPLNGVDVRISQAGFPTETTITGKDGDATVLCHSSISCDIKLSLTGYMPAAVTLTPQDVARPIG